MYLPLRAGGRFRISQRKTDREGVSPTDLLARERPLVIRGAAGVGKNHMRFAGLSVGCSEYDEAFPLDASAGRPRTGDCADPQCKGGSPVARDLLQEWIAGLLGESGWEGELQEAFWRPKRGSTARSPHRRLGRERGPWGKNCGKSVLVLMKHYRAFRRSSQAGLTARRGLRTVRGSTF